MFDAWQRNGTGWTMLLMSKKATFSKETGETAGAESNPRFTTLRTGDSRKDLILCAYSSSNKLRVRPCNVPDGGPSLRFRRNMQ